LLLREFLSRLAEEALGVWLRCVFVAGYQFLARIKSFFGLIVKV
jgi:hypothetical protein